MALVQGSSPSCGPTTQLLTHKYKHMARANPDQHCPRKHRCIWTLTVSFHSGGTVGVPSTAPRSHTSVRRGQQIRVEVGVLL